MPYLKRQKVPKNWPVSRKGTAYVVRPISNLETGLPLLVILRDVLKLAQNRKEAKKVLNQGNVLLNGKKVKNEKAAVLLFDVVSIAPLKKSYRLGLTEKGKFAVKEISEKEAERKMTKVIGKKILKGKKTQINLLDGRNFLSSDKCKVNDSVIIDLKQKKIEKCLSLKEKSKIIVFEGKHAGEEGIIKSIDWKNKTAEVSIDKNNVNILIKQMMVVE